MPLRIVRRMRRGIRKEEGSLRVEQGGGDMSDDDGVLEAIREGHLREIPGEGRHESRVLVSTKEIWQIFEPLLCMASPRQKRSIYLRYRRGLTLREAAREMGIKTATVSVYLKRFGMKVRRLMANYPHN